DGARWRRRCERHPSFLAPPDRGGLSSLPLQRIRQRRTESEQPARLDRRRISLLTFASLRELPRRFAPPDQRPALPLGCRCQGRKGSCASKRHEPLHRPPGSLIGRPHSPPAPAFPRGNSRAKPLYCEFSV